MPDLTREEVEDELKANLRMYEYLQKTHGPLAKHNPEDSIIIRVLRDWLALEQERTNLRLRIRAVDEEHEQLQRDR